jgi:hypothetical protein
MELGGRGLVALRIEFDYAGRTYTVESPSIQMWNVYQLGGMNDKMTIETDVHTGRKIFVTWGQVGVIRLLSPVDEKGFAKS